MSPKDFECPYCHAAAGKNCMTNNKRPRVYFHTARIELVPVEHVPEPEAEVVLVTDDEIVEALAVDPLSAPGDRPAPVVLAEPAEPEAPRKSFWARLFGRAG